MDRNTFLGRKTQKAFILSLRKARKRKNRKYWNKYHPKEGNIGRYVSRLIRMPETIDVLQDEIGDTFVTALDQAMQDPSIGLDFRHVQTVSLRAGLLLKAFSDEYMQRYQLKPIFRCPYSEKTKAVFRYLEIRNYSVKKGRHYADLDCWHITSFDRSKDEDVPKLLTEVIIPKCLEERNEKENAPIATAISEALFNCKEHAYNDNSLFQKWYLGYGRYPHAKSFHFCVCDKGIGFRASMQLGFTQKLTFDDSRIIQEAAKGRTGVKAGKKNGRGQGLQTAIENLAYVRGEMTIMSGKGIYTAGVDEQGNALDRSFPPRKTSIVGSIIDFSIPTTYSREGR